MGPEVKSQWGPWNKWSPKARVHGTLVSMWAPHKKISFFIRKMESLPKKGPKSEVFLLLLFFGAGGTLSPP